MLTILKHPRKGLLDCGVFVLKWKATKTLLWFCILTWDECMGHLFLYTFYGDLLAIPMRCVSLHFLQVYKNSSSGISGCFSGRPPNPIGTSPNKTPSLAASQTPFCVERHGFWLALSCASQVIFSDHRNPLPFQGTTFGNGKLILKRVLGREYVSARRGYVSNHSEFLVLYVFVCFWFFLFAHKTGKYHHS